MVGLCFFYALCSSTDMLNGIFIRNIITPGSSTLLAIALCAASCAVGCAAPTALTGTPMSMTCQEVPTVEECRTEAQVIEDDCLRECVLMQCSGVELNCNDHVQQRCKELNGKREATVGGFVDRESQSCEKPNEEIGWCQVPMSPKCRAKAMVHELAHSCGWSHGGGKNVPAENGRLQCK